MRWALLILAVLTGCLYTHPQSGDAPLAKPDCSVQSGNIIVCHTPPEVLHHLLFDGRGFVEAFANATIMTRPPRKCYSVQVRTIYRSGLASGLSDKLKICALNYKPEKV